MASITYAVGNGVASVWRGQSSVGGCTELYPCLDDNEHNILNIVMSNGDYDGVHLHLHLPVLLCPPQPIASSYFSSHLLTRNSSGDEIAKVNFRYDDIVHALQNTIDSCINSATDLRSYVLEHRFTKFNEIRNVTAITPFKVIQCHRSW